MLANLIGTSRDEGLLIGYVDDMIKLTMDEVCSRQSLSLRKLEDYFYCGW